jgi:hypothetical protein
MIGEATPLSRLRTLHDLKIVRGPMGCQAFGFLVRNGFAERRYISHINGNAKCDYIITNKGREHARIRFRPGA